MTALLVALLALPVGAVSPPVDCATEAREMLAATATMTNEMARRIAVQELQQALEEAEEDGEDACADRLEIAREIVRTQPFRAPAGEKFGMPLSERPPEPPPPGSDTE